MKKTILILIFCLSLTMPVFAGDTDAYYAWSNNAKLFTVTVESVTNQNVEVKVIHKIKGDVNENEILKFPYFEYNSMKYMNPKAGDNCFMAYVGDNEFYSIKTTSTDPKTLKFINHLTNKSMNMEGRSIYEHIEEKVNNGSYEEAEKERTKYFENFKIILVSFSIFMICIMGFCCFFQWHNNQEKLITEPLWIVWQKK